MIVPLDRLVFWTGFIALPLAVFFAADPSISHIIFAVGVAFILLAAMDAVLASKALEGISAEFTRVNRLTIDREGNIDIQIINSKQKAKRLRIGIKLPPEIASPFEDMAVEIPAGAKRSHVSWPCTAHRRGSYIIENIYLETHSPVGFWANRKVVSGAGCELRVYPNTLRERRNLAALFLNRGVAGLHAQRQVGKGREFEKLREYVPGDSYDDIHWKATAKRRKPITKVFQIERTQELYVVIDSSRLSAREVDISAAGNSTEQGVSTMTQLERFITAAMVLGLVAEKQGDLFGMLAFDDQVRSFVRARSGKAHYSACRDSLYTLQPSLTNPDFGEVFPFIRLRLRRRALLIFLTSLDDPVLAESFIRNLDLVSRHHLVLVGMLTDPTVEPLFRGPNPNKADDLYKRLGGHIQWHSLRQLERVLKRRGVTMRMLDNEMMCPQLVSEYINVKRRQAL